MLTLLEARGFRNLEPLSWAVTPGRHLLLGSNGAGKTSILEAIYVLATTRSFRAPRLSVCVAHEEQAFGLEAEVEDKRRWRLGVSWGRGDGLTRVVDGSAMSLMEHLEVLPVVAWTAEEGEVVTGEPEHRRRFMDRGVVGSRPAALSVLSRYRQTLDQKRELLSSGSGPGPLEPWNELLADAAAQLIAARARYVSRLEERFRQVAAEAELGFPEIELRYRPSPERGEDGASAIREVLERMLDRERAAGFSLVGPQRDDLEILWGGQPVRAVASAGERKALSLLLSAAHGRVLGSIGREPLHLLDDLDAELAPTVLERVWRCFGGVRQLIATSNRAAVWENHEPDRVWTVGGGRLDKG